MEAPIDGGLTAEPTPAVRTFTQILSKVSPSSEDKHGGKKPNKLQKKNRAPSGVNPSAHSSMHSLTGVDNPPSPMPQPALPHYHPSGSREILQSSNNNTVSSRNSGVTLKPSMSPSASFKSHSTATEYSETEQAEEVHREEKRSFWKSNKRNDNKATPTASQTDLHGNVPGADKSISSFGSSGWGGRQSFQHDSLQGSETSMPYNIPEEDEEHGNKKSRFGFFKRHEQKDRSDRKARAQSPPGSTSEFKAPQALVRPGGVPAGRGRSMDIPRTATSERLSDVTPTGTSPNPLVTSTPTPTPTPQNHDPTSQAAPAARMPHRTPHDALVAQNPHPNSEAAPSAQAPRPISHGSPNTNVPRSEPSAQPHYQSLIPPLPSDASPPNANPPA